MYKVMIVEDEMLVRFGFKNSVPWEKFGMTVCADTSNGQEAWDYYNHVAKPDVIFTDLKMPKMDGMELIRRIRKHDDHTRIVILSCLEDFELVRQAMKMGVSNYIVKLTMTDEEIEEVLSGVSEELGKLKSRETSKGIIHNPHLLKENIIKNFVYYQLYSEEEFVQHIANLRLQLHPGRLVACMMEINHFERLQAKFMDEQGELIRVTLLNVLNELLTDKRRGEVVSDDDTRYLFILSFHDIASESQIRDLLHRLFTQVQKALDRFFNISVAVGISSIRNEYGSLRALYKESVDAVNSKFYFDSGYLLFYRELNEERIGDVVRGKLLKLKEKWKQLDLPLQPDLGTVFGENSADMPRNPHHIRNLLIRLLHAPSVFVSMQEDEITRLDTTYGEALRTSETLEESVRVFSGFLDELARLQSRKRQLSKEVAHIVQQIQEHYHEDISLQDFAEQLNLTPNYVSTLFKKEMELPFSEYLYRIRLEKAKDLLLTTNLKSYEIAERIGFSDDSYFSRAFKKYVGVRPNSFRRIWVNDRMG